MTVHRRNVVTRVDGQFIMAIAAASAVLAALSGVEPTGETAIDLVLAAALGGLVAWAGATSSWWALLAGSGLALSASVTGPVVLIVVAAVALLASYWLSVQKLSKAPMRALIAAAVVQVVLRFEWDPFLGASALVAAVAIGMIGVTGVIRRPRYVRKRVLWSSVGVAAAAVLAVGGMGVSGVQAREPASEGYRGLLLGLEYLESGRMTDAANALRSAADDLGQARDHVTRPWTQPARMVPIVSQNRTLMADVLGRAAEAADQAADTLGFVDIDQLRIVNGRVDLGALATLEQPLAELETTVAELRAALDDADSPWLLDPFQERLDRSRVRAEQVSHQARAASELARLGPAILGADEPRRYLLAFTNPGESRGSSGLIGNWTEITIDGGKMSESASGRAAALSSPIAAATEPVRIDMPEDFFDRYGWLGAGEPDTTVRPKFWSNINMSPDMASVGSAMVQLYPFSTGREIDGVFLIDPAGIASLLSVTGAIEVPELGVSLNAGNVERFLLVDQYEAAESDREAVLEAVTKATIDRVLGGELPPPQDLAKAMGPAALEGHISAWLVRPDEQATIELVGMDGTLPAQTPDMHRMDAIAVVSQNGGGNKIDSFLHRTVDYDAVYDSRTGRVDATVTVTLENAAPRSGFDEYVIGNLLELPMGTNRHLVEIFTPLDGFQQTIDGRPNQALVKRELGWNVYSTFVEIPPESSVTVVQTMSGYVSPDQYELLVRPQALPNADRMNIDVRDQNGDRVVRFEGQFGRRNVLSGDGLRAWRPAG